MRWEKDPFELRSLNPVCCLVSNDIVIWPYYILAIFSIFLGLLMLIAAATNIGIANNHREDDEIYKSLGLIDYICLGLIIILALILLFYILFRATP